VYKNAIIINSDTLGKGDREIGHTLLGTILRKMLASIDKPDVIIFYSSGVKLVVRGSYFIDILDALECAGVELLACGTCVSTIGRNSILAVGRTTNMEEITDIILKAEKVVTL
jgi:hypothetical protein